MPVNDISVGEAVKRALDEAMRERGHANILLAGRTGVGKSTLINSVFQGQFATTGQGRPVTEGTREIRKEGIPLTLFDTRGLEMAEFATTLTQLRTFVAERRRDQDARKHVHVAWVCVSEDLRRVEEAESKLVDVLSDFMPVVVVVTKARADHGFRAEVQRLLPRTTNTLRVRAIDEVLDDGHTLPAMGLVELIQATLELIPEGQRRAFVAAQKADLEMKRKRSHLVVGGAAAAAAGVAAIPIPFADAALLVPIQLGMLAGISTTYGLDVSEAFLGTLIGTTVGSTAATVAGRAIVAGILKLIPGVGSVVGGAIAAATAVAMTTSLGEIYIAALAKLFAKHGGEQPTPEEVLDAVRSAISK